MHADVVVHIAARGVQTSCMWTKLPHLANIVTTFASSCRLLLLLSLTGAHTVFIAAEVGQLDEDGLIVRRAGGAGGLGVNLQAGRQRQAYNGMASPKCNHMAV